MVDDPSNHHLLPLQSNEFVHDFNPFSDLISAEVDFPSLVLGNFVGSTNPLSCGQVDIFGSEQPNSLLMDGLLNQLDEGDDNGEDEDNHSSSDTTTTLSTPTTMKTSKADRSRTLISERRRRGRMKEKLYALRALVPTITKMDKASIVGDAVLYVQDLQIQAKKLKAEIAGLEASLSGEGGHPPEDRPNKRTQLVPPNPKHICGKILQMDMFQVEERGFYTRIVCSRGVGLAVSLYKALESLTTFNVETSNLSSASPDRFVLTFTLTIKEGEQNMNLSNTKLWITGALLNQGFEIEITS